MKCPAAIDRSALHRKLANCSKESHRTDYENIRKQKCCSMIKVLGEKEHVSLHLQTYQLEVGDR